MIGDIPGAKDDLLESTKILPSFTQSWVKIASVYMEQGDPKQAFEAFEEAIKHNPKDPDIYYHRGQGVLRVGVSPSPTRVSVTSRRGSASSRR